jgi:DNA helicase-2/ATP-dependent DNA helicase PcrA
MTRAKERLVLTHALERRLYGYPQANLVSRFVREIPKDAVEFAGLESPAAFGLRDRAPWSSASHRKERTDLTTAPLQPVTSSSSDQYYKGAVVRHAKFGIGTVQRSEGAGEERKISVSFPGHGVKTLSLKYANLESI